MTAADVGRVGSVSGAMRLAEDIVLFAAPRNQILWCERAVKPLAALIYAASAYGNGFGLCLGG